MRHIRNIATIVLFLSVSISALASSGNPKVKKNQHRAPKAYATLEGTWMHLDDHGREKEFVTFRSNGTGVKWEECDRACQQCGCQGKHKARKESFTYSVSDKKQVHIHLIEADGDHDTERLRIINDKKIIIDGDTYVRQKK